MANESNIIERMRNIRAEMDEAKSKSERLSGRLDHLMAELKAESGVDTLSKAESKLKALEAALAKSEAKLLKLLDQAEGALHASDQG